MSTVRNLGQIRGGDFLCGKRTSRERPVFRQCDQRAASPHRCIMPGGTSRVSARSLHLQWRGLPLFPFALLTMAGAFLLMRQCQGRYHVRHRLAALCGTSPAIGSQAASPITLQLSGLARVAPQQGSLSPGALDQLIDSREAGLPGTVMFDQTADLVESQTQSRESIS